MTATRWGDPPWRVAVDLPAAAPPARADVVVVGGGFTGLSTALHAARAGASVVVLEADRLGHGASGRTGAIVLEGTAHGPLPGVDRCLDALADVVAREAITCDLRLPGCDLVAHRRADDVRGSPLAWPDDGRVIAIVDHEPGGTVDPGALVAGLARAAVTAGATICEHTPLLDIARAPLVARTPAGDVAARHVVVGTNAWLARILSLPVRVRAALTLAVATEPLAREALDALGLAGDRPFYTVDQPYLWGRVTAAGGLVLGAGLAFAERVEDLAVDDAEVAAAFTRLTARIRGFHPRLRDARLTHRWAGPIAFTARGTPIACAVDDLPGVLCAGAYAGHGVALGVRMGQLLADAAVRGTPLPAWGTPR